MTDLLARMIKDLKDLLPPEILEKLPSLEEPLVGVLTAMWIGGATATLEALGNGPIAHTVNQIQELARTKPDVFRRLMSE